MLTALITETDGISAEAMDRLYDAAETALDEAWSEGYEYGRKN